jgi:hypothetical protein
MGGNILKIFFLTFISIAYSLFAKEYVIAPTPSFVQPAQNYLCDSLQQFPDSTSTYYLLNEEQVDVASHQDYWHIAYKIISHGGLQDATQIALSVNPAYEKVLLHTLKVIRNKEILDMLHTVKIKVIQREERLESNLYDGKKQILIILDGLKLDDIVDYSYSKVGDNPIFQNKIFDLFDVQWGSPVRRFRTRIIMPLQRPLYWKNHGSKFMPKVYESKVGREYVWEQNNIPALYTEGETPDWYNEYPFVEVTEFRGWKEMVDWAVTQYPFDKKDTIPGQDIKRIIGQDTAKADQLIKILRFVQNDIRYLGFETGINSHKPHRAQLTFYNRYGDCKDKVYLFCTMLRAVGIESYPVLVNTDFRSTIKEYLPSPLDFDHVIATAFVNGKQYFLDPVLQHQQGVLEWNYSPDYGKGLVIRAGDTALTAIPFSAEKSYVQLRESYLSTSFTDDAILEIETRLGGFQADDIRDYFARNTKAFIQKEYVNYYARQFPGVYVLDTVRYTDIKDSNCVVLKESYGIKEFWEIKGGKDTGTYYCEFVPDPKSMTAKSQKVCTAQSFA